MITDTPIIKIVIHPMTLDIVPLVLLCITFLSLAIFMIAIRIGTATTPLITAAYTRAFIGSIFMKFIHILLGSLQLLSGKMLWHF